MAEDVAEAEGVAGEEEVHGDNFFIAAEKNARQLRLFFFVQVLFNVNF